MRHRFHALCPYFAMFPETFAEHWIEKLTNPGDLVLDPFCGRGTTPFQALLMDRQAMAGDINPVAYCITRAKTNAPAASAVKGRLTKLEKEYTPEPVDEAAEDLPEFFRHAYADATLRQILFLRSRLNWRGSDVDCMIAALTLGALHGESSRSPSYLSNQMPRTISTKPAYSIRYWRDRRLRPPERNAFQLLHNRVEYRYVTGRPQRRATVLCSDMRELPRATVVRDEQVKAVITSPPYLDITNFEEDQWLRLWFLEGPPYPTRFRLSRDDRHYSLDAYWGLIGDTWRALGRILQPKGHVVMRLGFKALKPERIVEGVQGAGALSGRTVQVVGYDVSDIRKRQTDSFRPGSKGCLREVDVHLQMS